ncbi:MAG: S41 family peptidase [Gemmatimonadaceae bacterium]|jgi:carboxyl-terminal processing protease|nr:S41 family peptidase [Gemmatimonadaceae bacterium]
MHPTRRRLAIVGLAALPLVAGGFVLQARAARSGPQLLDQVLTFVALRYVDTLDASALYEKAARGLVRELNDPYSELLTPKQLAEFSRNTQGRYAGLGMEIVPLNGYVTVGRVFSNTPAEAGGVQEGDRIVKIDTANARGWSTQQVQNRLLGTPGTPVTVTFGRVGVPQPIVQTFTRAEIHVPAVRTAMLIEPKTGYIQLERFNENTAEEVSAAVRDLTTRGATGLVLDVRNNPGGILDQAIATSNLFVDQGKEIASVRGRGDMQRFYSQDRPAAPATPLVVLVNGNSASAAEIVAGALQDLDRALVIGTTSFGKGLVQSVFNIDGGYALKMTTAKWFTPSGRSIQRERKFQDGAFIEEAADTTRDADSLKKAKPAFKSASGRTIYGGGGITPDVIVNDDTLSTAELTLARALAPKGAQFFSLVSDLALENKPGLRPDFSLKPEWREELWKRLGTQNIKVDRAVWDAGAAYVDRTIENRFARVAFGDSTARRHDLRDDVQLLRALEYLRKANGTQRQLMALAMGPAPVADPKAKGAVPGTRPMR